jgi:hypothetical protein
MEKKKSPTKDRPDRRRAAELPYALGELRKEDIVDVPVEHVALTRCKLVDVAAIKLDGKAAVGAGHARRARLQRAGHARRVGDQALAPRGCDFAVGRSKRPFRQRVRTSSYQIDVAIGAAVLTCVTPS